MMSQHFLRIVLATLTTAALVTVTACAMTPTPAADALRVGHIHDLAFNTDGDLYIGTHTGVYRADAATDALTLVGDLSFDAMGLTVQQDTLYVSGHPDPTNLGPFTAPHIGLARFDSNAWTPVSLEGTTDFHVLATTPADPGLILGAPADRPVLWQSTDAGQSWNDSITPLVTRDVAIDTRDPNLITAITDDGVVVSENGGVSFMPLPDAPPLVLIAADPGPEQGLIGVDATGQVWTGTASGGPWSMAGHTGDQPSAIAIAPDGAIAYADQDGVFLSRDRSENPEQLPIQQ